MIYPVRDWSKWYDAQPYGTKTDYGYHDGADINLKTGGDTDLGEDLLAISDGVVTSVHIHTNSNNYGKHIHIQHDGPWGTVYCHYAHCSEILVKEGDTVKQGQVVAKVGKSGTVYSHCHWAIKLQPTGVDGIARTLEDLAKWTDPIKFVEMWIAESIIEKQMPDDIRLKILDENGILTEGDTRASVMALKELQALREDKINADKEIDRLRHQVEQDKADLKMESDANSALKQTYEEHMATIGKDLGNGSDLPGIRQCISQLKSRADIADKYEGQLKALQNNNSDLKAEIIRTTDMVKTLNDQIKSLENEIVLLKKVRPVAKKSKSIINLIKLWLKR